MPRLTVVIATSLREWDKCLAYEDAGEEPDKVFGVLDYVPLVGIARWISRTSRSCHSR
jgi:hypothetical protein